MDRRDKPTGARETRLPPTALFGGPGKLADGPEHPLELVVAPVADFIRKTHLEHFVRDHWMAALLHGGQRSGPEGRVRVLKTTPKNRGCFVAGNEGQIVDRVLLHADVRRSHESADNRLNFISGKMPQEVNGVPRLVRVVQVEVVDDARHVFSRDGQ